MGGELVQLAWIAFFSILAQWIGWRFKIPAIVFFLIFGFLSGPVLQLIQPHILLGDLLQPLTAIAVGIILFEGSLNLNFKEINKARFAIRHFTLIGAPLAWGLISLSAFYIGGLSWPVAVTFGALLIVTGPTVIIPLLKNARLTERTSSVLKWEGIINDPIGAVLAVLSYEYFKDRTSVPNFEATDFFSSTFVVIILISLASGLVGLAIGRMFNRGYIPEYMKSAFLLSFVVVFFVICNQIQHESGLIAVTILGVTLANMGLHSLEEIKKFKETMTIMLVSGVFIVITAQIDPRILFNIDWRGILFIVSVLVVIRPITATISSVGTQLTWPEVWLTGWIAPRGIVCAAVAGVTGPLLVEAGYADGEQMFPLAFAIVLLTVFLHGLSVKPLAKYLNLSFPQKESLIIVGASSWSIQLAETLKARGVEVIIADKNWYSLKQARLSEIPSYYGEILSEETEYNMELSRYNMIVALANNPAYNSLVCSKFSHEFSRERTYQLRPHEEDEHESRQITESVRGRDFGDGDLDYWDILSLFNQGWRFRTTKIGKHHNLQDLQAGEETQEIKVIGYIKTLNAGQQMLVLRRPKNLKSLNDDDFVILFENRSEKSKGKP